MSLFDKTLLGRARQLISKNPSGVDRGLRSVGDAVNKRTGGR